MNKNMFVARLFITKLNKRFPILSTCNAKKVIFFFLNENEKYKKFKILSYNYHHFPRNGSFFGEQIYFSTTNYVIQIVYVIFLSVFYQKFTLFLFKILVNYRSTLNVS